MIKMTIDQINPESMICYMITEYRLLENKIIKT